MMFLHMMLLMKFPFLPTGVRFMSSLLGGSVANASAPSVSMIMLTQSNCTAVSGALPELTSRSTRISDNKLRKKLAMKFKMCHQYNKRPNIDPFYFF